jgi:hypothetical protein
MMESVRAALRDAHSILDDPFGFFKSISADKETRPRSIRYTVGWFILFSIVPALLLPLWKPLTDWAFATAVVKIPDLHFANEVYLSMSLYLYPLIYSYLGDSFRTWLVCFPLLMLDLLANLLVGAGVFHLFFRYALGGNGRYRDALAVLAFGDLPSLLFGFLPYSAAIGLAWTSLLQIPVGFHYVYKVSWKRAFIPYVLWTVFIFVSWGTRGTVSSAGLIAMIPKGPYSL